MVPSKINQVTVPCSVSPKEMVVGHEKSYLVREIVTGRVVFTMLTHLLHGIFVMLRVPGGDRERDAVLQMQLMQLERFHTRDTNMRRVIPQDAPTGDFSW